MVKCIFRLLLNGSKASAALCRLVRIDILATLGLAFYIPAGEPEIQALIAKLLNG